MPALMNILWSEWQQFSPRVLLSIITNFNSAVVKMFSILSSIFSSSSLLSKFFLVLFRGLLQQLIFLSPSGSIAFFQLSGKFLVFVELFAFFYFHSGSPAQQNPLYVRSFSSQQLNWGLVFWSELNDQFVYQYPREFYAVNFFG